MQILRSMSITANKANILETLKKNRETHAAIVAEARAGYMVAAKKALKSRMRDLASGKLVSLTFHLSPPQDYTNVYDMAISMLELDTGTEIKLDSTQVQNLVHDKWDWTDHFLTSNSAYSSTAGALVVGASR